MNKRQLLCATLALILVLAGGVTYSSYAAAFKSNGRLEYNNGTPDNPVDDVIFDSSDLKTLDASITTLDTRITNISIQINEGLQDIIDAIDKYPGVDLDGGNTDAGGADGSPGTTPSFGDIVTAIENITVLPTDTYFYEDGTEGDANIVRFKKIDGKYYPCDSHGEVAPGTAEVDVSQKTLIDYTGAVAGNISAGKMGYADGYLHLGDGADNAAHYAQGFVDGQQDVTQNLNISYTYHVHEGDASASGGCYTKAVMHSHTDACNGPCPGTWGSRVQTVVDGITFYIYTCNTCGITKTTTSYDGVTGTNCGATTIVCGKTGRVESYGLSCGKTEQTIESATIIY